MKTERLGLGLRLALAIGAVLVLWPSLARPQVRHLWRTGLTNAYSPRTNFTATASCLDLHGNLLVAGVMSFDDWGTPSDFLAKFSDQGQLIWLRQGRSNFFGTVAALMADSSDNALMLLWGWGARPPELQLVKVAADGIEAWRVTEWIANSDGGVYSACPPSTIGVDANDNAFVLGFRRVAVDADQFGWELFVSKVASDGQRLWTTPLPGLNYVGSEDMTKCLNVLPNDGLVVTGHQGTPNDGGFVARYDDDGRLVWFRNSHGTEKLPPYLNSVRSNPQGNICASGTSGSVVLSSDGLILRNNDDWLRGGMVSHTSPEGDFLLDQFWSASVVWLDSTGQSKWRGNAGYWSSIGVAPVDGGGCLWAGTDFGVNGELVQLHCFSPEGDRIWSQQVDDVPPPYRIARPGDGILRASDDTYRMVWNRTNARYEPDSIAVLAFALTAPPEHPVITRSPDPCNWDGRSNVVLQAEAAGSEPLEYQWFHMTSPIPGATNRTLAIASNDVPYYRGFLFVRISEINGIVVSRSVELRAGATTLKAWPPNSTGVMTVSVYADIGVRYELETSTNLVHWKPVPGGAGSFVSSTQVQVPENGQSFFRAALVP